MPSARVALPEPHAAGRAFARAAERFDASCVVHDEARRRLLERLEWMRIAPAVIADVGCATGLAARALAERFPSARVVALDPSAAMLQAARTRAPAAGSVTWIRGAAEALPLASGGVQLAVANLSLPWCDPARAFAELARVLPAGGLALFASLGPDTCIEVRRAWAAADDAVHVHAFIDMHDLGDLAVGAGLGEPVLDVDRIALSYSDVTALVNDLRAWGAVNVAAGRRRTLTGRRRWARFAAVLRGAGGAPFNVTVELVLGHAWGSGRPAERGAAGEIAVPASAIRRRR